MRITNKVMQNNSINNINTNKVLQDQLSNQMATEKKIIRPSDDPIIAIRALRLRSNVSQVTQFYDKNVPDAESWMKLTEDSITAVSEVITDMIQECTKGASEKLTFADRNTILDAMKEFKKEVYATGNADYAGRSLFTGYRTETTLKYTEPETKQYSITEQVPKDALDTTTYISVGDITDINEVNFNTGTNATIVEQQVEESTICRLRLSYGLVDDTLPVLKTYDAASGDFVDFNTAGNTEVISASADPNPYDQMKTYEEANATGTPTDRFILIPETGELLMTKSAYDKLTQLKDDVATANLDESEIRVTYDKSSWQKDDLRPEHYFACTANPGGADAIEYNQDYLKGIYAKQVIEYDVAMNQSIRVNTTADEVFVHAIGRDIDDLVASMQEVVDLESTVEKLTALSEKYIDPTTTEYVTVRNQLDAANKALTLAKEKSQQLFEGSITKMQNHLDRTNYATTTCGTREKKLDLINNRLMSQKTNFETLQSQNEDIDLAEAAIKLSGAELTYNAALMSVGKIMQTSLMNYI